MVEQWEVSRAESHKQLERLDIKFSAKAFAFQSFHTVFQGLLSHCSHREQKGNQFVYNQAPGVPYLVLIIYFVWGTVVKQQASSYLLEISVPSPPF